MKLSRLHNDHYKITAENAIEKLVCRQETNDDCVSGIYLADEATKNKIMERIHYLETFKNNRGIYSF